MLEQEGGWRRRGRGGGGGEEEEEEEEEVKRPEASGVAANRVWSCAGLRSAYPSRTSFGRSQPVRDRGATRAALGP